MHNRPMLVISFALRTLFERSKLICHIPFCQRNSKQYCPEFGARSLADLSHFDAHPVDPNRESGTDGEFCTEIWSSRSGSHLLPRSIISQRPLRCHQNLVDVNNEFRMGCGVRILNFHASGMVVIIATERPVCGTCMEWPMPVFMRAWFAN